jgi:Omp85 superfamily domain
MAFVLPGRTTGCRFTAAVLLTLACLSPTAAAAQQTRAETIEAEQADKAIRLEPYTPSVTEQRISRVMQTLTNTPSVYAYIGSVFPGGWFAVGPGYRTRVAGTGHFDAHAAWSLKNYKTVDTTLKLPEIAHGLVQFNLRANWLDAPKVAFYGVGGDTVARDKTSFLFRSTSVGATAQLQPFEFLSAGVGFDYLNLDTGRGRIGTSIEQRFSPADAAGVGASPTYNRSQIFAEIDWRESPGYTRSGGLYRFDWYQYDQKSGGRYSFRRLDAEVDQFIPLLHANWVLALRAMASLTDTDAGEAVPYFMLPELGGARMLRGYPIWRFRGRDRLLLTAEYRWMAGQFVDMALFVDAGKVTATRSELALRGLKHSVGIGVRFHTLAATVLRIEAARTRDEGIGLIFAFGPSF